MGEGEKQPESWLISKVNIKAPLKLCFERETGQERKNIGFGNQASIKMRKMGVGWLSGLCVKST